MPTIGLDFLPEMKDTRGYSGMTARREGRVEHDAYACLLVGHIRALINVLQRNTWRCNENECFWVVADCVSMAS